GTWLRLLIKFPGKKRPIFERLAAPPLRRLPGALKSILRRRGIAKASALWVASRGVWSHKEKNALRKNLADLAGKVRITSDVEAAWWSAFHKPPGILILSGTGSIAYGIGRRNRSSRSGGHAPAGGDPGSGYWIGRQAGYKGSVRKVASHARNVIQAASGGDARARRIVERAQDNLLNLVLRVRRKLGGKDKIPVSWSGGVFENKSFREGFAGKLRAGSRDFLPRAPKSAALAGPRPPFWSRAAGLFK
ncbi:MAG: hypothetical protein HY611_02460, partial [Elusimicrobia bacterium]|nr:hypothetical protein [Elusimicrobiota bacterium]